MKLIKYFFILTITLSLCAVSTLSEAKGLVSNTSFADQNGIVIHFFKSVDSATASSSENYYVVEEQDPDIRIPVTDVKLSKDNKKVVLRFAEPLNTAKKYRVTLLNIGGEEKTVFSVSKPYVGFLFSILLGAFLIHNFVFTKYLGLCVFFGTSKKKATAKGMGVVFTICIVFATSISWLLNQYVLKPYDLTYLQIIVFIGLVSLTVQAVDTILRKINPILFKEFGVYLVLVIANCVILAVPLIMATEEYNYWETFMLSLGAGLGFLLALYLMGIVRERMELAGIPPTFKGLPIAFVLAGQFALAFLGFSGLKIF
ncbi:MAG: NADH-quinone reductase [Deltaproteobacteria bacterium]|nr:NADH-quinone reductase [Deltaproteobacteria bacterium]